MQRIVQEIRICLENQCNFAALALALIIPDVCASFEKQGKTKGRDYISWCNKWITDLELEGEVIYSLRCSLFHSGDGNLDVHPVYKKYMGDQKKSGEKRNISYKFFFPHEDAEEDVIYQKSTDTDVQNTICVALLTSGILDAYENFKQATPDFSHDYINLWLEG